MPYLHASGLAAVNGLGNAFAAHLAPFLGWLLHNSAASACVAVMVLLAQAAFGRWISPAWRYRLWGLVVLRLMLPALPPALAGVPSVESLLPTQRIAAWAGTGSQVKVQTPLAQRWLSGGADAFAMSGDRGRAVAPKVTVIYGEVPRDVAPVAAAVAAPAPIADGGAHEAPASIGARTTIWIAAASAWMLGVILLLYRLIASNAAVARQLRLAAPVTDPAVLALLGVCCREARVARRPPLLVTDAVAAPAAAGVLRPVLLVPPGLLPTLSESERRAVLLHELAHVRRRDVAGNWLLAVTQIFHWFNPVLWLAFARLRADRESARDAMVLRLLAGDGRGGASHHVEDAARGYAQTLLKLAETLVGQPRLSGALAARFNGFTGFTGPVGFAGMIDRPPRANHHITPGFGGRTGFQRRLHMIARFSEKRRFGFAGPAVALALAGCALTGARPASTTAPAASAAPAPTATAPAAPAPTTAPATASATTRPAEVVATLIARVRYLVSQGHYTRALEQTEAILKLDPANDFAIGIRPLLEDKIAKGHRRLVIVDEDDKSLRERLGKAVPEVKLEGVAFSEAIDFLRDVTGANIFVNWKALETAGIRRDAPVTARLFNVRFSKALDHILAAVSTPHAKLGYETADGVITITTAGELNKNVETRVYDIRDLIVAVPDFEPDHEAMSTVPTTRPDGPAPRAGSRPSTGLASAPAVQDAGAGSENEHTRQERVAAVKKLVTDTIASDSWKEKGGAVGAIQELSGQLIVMTTPENHQQLNNLLTQLRETRGIQVSVESRFVSCDEKVVGALLAEWKKAAKTDGAPASQPVFLPTTEPGSDKSRAAAAFLNDVQVNQFLKASQDAEGSALVAAPRMTLLNGQRAYVLVASEHAYVRDFTTTRTDAGETRYDPVFGTTRPGLLMDVRATVSADRQWVTLTLRPKMSALLGMSETPWPSRPAGSKLVVQQPLLKVSELQTTASVPDHGALLLGGLEDPGIVAAPLWNGTPPTTAPSTTGPATTAPFTRTAEKHSLFLLVRPTIIRPEQVESGFPLLGPKKAQTKDQSRGQ